MEPAQEREVTKARRAKPLEMRHEVTGVGVCLLGLGLALVQHFLTVSIPLFGTVIYILCHCIPEVCNLLFDFT